MDLITIDAAELDRLHDLESAAIGVVSLHPVRNVSPEFYAEYIDALNEMAGHLRLTRNFEIDPLSE